MWTGVPVQRIAGEESERVLQMEAALHERVVGQNEAIKAISKAVRRACVPGEKSQAAHRHLHAATRHAGKNGLIRLAVGVHHLALANVGRQGNAADAVEDRRRLAGRVRPNDPNPLRLTRHQRQHGGRRALEIDQRYGLARFQPPAGLREDSPQPAGIGLEKQPLPAAARGGA